MISFKDYSQSQRLFQEWSAINDELEALWKQQLLNASEIEILEAVRTNLWHRFEEATWLECRLPRHELMIKRANHG